MWLRNTVSPLLKICPGGQRTGGQKDGWMDGWMDGRTVGYTDERTDGWMDDRVVGWNDGWMDGWIVLDLFIQKSYTSQSVVSRKTTYLNPLHPERTTHLSLLRPLDVTNVPWEKFSPSFQKGLCVNHKMRTVCLDPCTLWCAQTGVWVQGKPFASNSHH